MTREISESFREAIDTQESEVFPIVFLEIKHPSLSESVRIVQNGANIKLDAADPDSRAYQGFDFDISILADSDKPPSAQLRVQNIDRQIGVVLLDISEPAIIDMRIFSSALFDESVTPHEPLAPNPVAEYTALNLYLIDVEIKNDFVTGTLKTWEYTQETYPTIFATEDRTPGLYW